MEYKREVLDKGSVELIDFMGDDYRILQAARVSTGAQAKKGDEKDRGLIRYLYRNNHISPFEMATLTFYVKCPIFVARQWFRHRTMSFNEASGRYKEFEWETYKPETWRIQDTKNKQGSVIEDKSLDPTWGEMNDRYYDALMEDAENVYDYLLTQGVAREQARLGMPVSHYTEFFFTVNLRNLFHFLELRLDFHAQYEIRLYAEAIFDILKQLNEFKWSVEIFGEMNQINQAVRKMVNASKDNLPELTEFLLNMIE